MQLFGKTISNQLDTLPAELQNACREIISEIVKLSSQSIDMDQFCSALVQRVHAIFNLYSANLYTVDSQNRWAVLKVGTSEDAQARQGTGHRIPFDSNSLVGKVANINEGIIRSFKRQDHIPFESVVLPPAHSELAIPIVLPSNNITVGVLEVQSEKDDAFGADHFGTFSIITACIALVFSDKFQMNTSDKKAA